MSEKPKAETEVTEKKSNSKMIIIILSVLLLLAGAGGAYFLLSKPAPAHAAGEGAPEGEVEAKHEEHEEHKPPVFVELEPFTVNLQPDGQFLQATFNLQVEDEIVAEEIKLYMPLIRSRLLLMLSNKTGENLSQQEGKTTLVTEMKELIQQPFSKGAKPLKIDNVFMTSFVIQ
jgi:flagellar FliL protein